MTTYARVLNGVVQEVYTLPDIPNITIAECFHDGIPGSWVDCTATEGVAGGWTYNGTVFEAAAPVAAPATTALAT